MKTLMNWFCFALMALLSAKAFAQGSPAPVRSNGPADSAVRAQPVDSSKAIAQKEAHAANRARRGTDLRMALTPQNTNSGVNGNLKLQGGVANVADTSTGDPSPEHHLNIKERQEMRELLRQQRLKQQQN